MSPPSSLAANVSNKPAFYAELLDAVEADQEKHLPNNPVLKLMAKKAQKAVIKLHASAELTDVRMDGEQAEGVIIYSIDDEEIEAPIAFKRLRGRWFLHVPDPADFGGMAGSPFAGIPLE